MRDIAKCNGEGCNKKATCLRYTCKASEYQTRSKFEPENCEFYIDN